MFPEFGQTPLCLDLDLDTYDGPWTYIAQFRGLSGWMQICLATIQSERDLLERRLIVACDENGRAIPAWRAVHLTQCSWSNLRPCMDEPPDLLDDLLCEAEGELYARWQRDMNANVAAEFARAAAEVAALDERRSRVLAQIDMERRLLRRERLKALSPHDRDALAQRIKELEASEDRAVEHFGARRRAIVRESEKREEALWDRTDVLIEVEPGPVIYWRARPGLLHGRRTLYEPRARRLRAYPVRLPAPTVRRQVWAGAQAALQPDPQPLAPIQEQAPVRSPQRTPRLSPEAIRLLENLAPLLNWEEGAHIALPPTVNAAVLDACQDALTAEALRLAGLEGDAGQPSQPRREVERMLAVLERVARRLAMHPVAMADQPPAEGQVSDDDDLAPIPAGPPAEQVIPETDGLEHALLTDREQELASRLRQLERTLAALKPGAPRRPRYLEQAAEAKRELDQIRQRLKLLKPDKWPEHGVADLPSHGPMRSEQTPAQPHDRAAIAPSSSDDRVMIARRERHRAVMARIDELRLIEASNPAWSKPWRDARQSLQAAEIELDELERRLSPAGPDNAMTEVPNPLADNAGTASHWTADRVALLKRMWAAGHSAAEIGQALDGVSRNAVISKAKRLGLAARAQV